MKPTLRTTMKGLRQAGFTLIELMIAVAIVAILARIAMGVYKQYVIRSNRADAEQVLLQVAQAAERWYVVNNSYSTFDLGNAGLNYSPTTATSSTYTYIISRPTALNPNTAQAFVFQATPNSAKVNARDGVLTISSTGAKGWDRNNDGTISSTENNWTP